VVALFLRYRNLTSPEFENPVKIGTHPVQKRIKNSPKKLVTREQLLKRD
jgi:hypothetical protein